MEILGKILGSPARVKIMRLFLLNKSKVFISKDVAIKSRVNPNMARKEIRLLESIDFIKSKNKTYFFNPAFKYTTEIEGLLINSDTLDTSIIEDSFKKVGRVKLLLISGIFIKNKDSRVDILIVGDNLKKGKIEETIRKFEAEIGAELVYTFFTTKDFLYRLNMYDKLVRDIIDFPHKVVIQAKELSTQALKKP